MTPRGDVVMTCIIRLRGTVKLEITEVVQFSAFLSIRIFITQSQNL